MSNQINPSVMSLTLSGETQGKKDINYDTLGSMVEKKKNLVLTSENRLHS